MILEKKELRTNIINDISKLIFDKNDIESYRYQIFNIICNNINNWFNEKALIKGVYSGVIPGSPPIPSGFNNQSFEFKLNLNLVGQDLKNAITNFENWVKVDRSGSPTDNELNPNPTTRNIQMFDYYNVGFAKSAFLKSSNLIVTIDFNFIINKIEFGGFPDFGLSPKNEDLFDFQIDTIINGLIFPDLGLVVPATCNDGSIGEITIIESPKFV